MHFRRIQISPAFGLIFLRTALSCRQEHELRFQINIWTIQKGDKCKCVHFRNGSAVPAIELCLCPVIFYLNGFNSVLTSCCQRTEMPPPLSFRGHQSFIITRIHQPILVITDYRQAVMWQDQGNTHSHTHSHRCLSVCHVRNQKHIYTLEGLEHALWLPPLFTEVLLNTLWNYKKFKSALQAVAGA